ncbi:serine carboxypeptidase-like 13 [Momordica charantia]|uniref:Serine carboxypeptidase-like 13 n=1 Tax=Momordica charantia TaxID=3673 RepID=A0A6J1DYT8_MOMCH|nr:serine carboxypeptidase-like 13 [Momordica charantia]
MAAIVFRSSVFFLLLFKIFSATATATATAVGSYRKVKFLPGFSGPLPFVLETGYVGVGESEEVQLFYYFVESEANPETDPLLLWLTGGPGCSALTSLAFEIGPISFKEERFNGSLPQIISNPYSWTKKSSIIFVDLPVGTGFSYGTTQEALETGDFSQVHHSLQFLKKWLADHPEFMSNSFYVGGDSYAGMIVPVVAQKILEGNSDWPFVNFQGYVLGNPVTIRNSNQNFQVPYAHRMTLISDELFEWLTTSCKGEYVNIDPNNVECLKHYDTYEKCVSKLEKGCILLPKCPFESPKQKDDHDRRSLYNTPKVFLDPKPPLPSLGCASYKFLLGYYWANDDQVQKALHIHEGSIGEWIRCKRREDYNFDIESAFSCHVNLSSKGYRSLVYSGDHDMVVPHLDTQAWIRSLNYSIVDDWRPWFIVDQIAGYTRTYANKMTFATIKGGGHTAEYTRKECSVMFSRWIAGESL